MIRAYIGLGANLGEPAAQLRQALGRLEALGRLIAVSPFYRSAAMGPGPQPDYCNAVCMLETGLSPDALMQSLLDIERAAGRTRDGRKWLARPLDLDLLHVPGVQNHTEALQLPHPGIAVRNFVLVPWADIDPQLELPGIGRIAEAAAAIGRADLRRWDDG
ncbi:MAG TPA: 2-amino-4-hydroxy-6-hydroxymethyldihydropteridine diphosphokinase [Solimonas sp.]